MIIRGDIIFTERKEEYTVYEDSHLIAEEGIIKGIYKNIPEEHRGEEVIDRRGKLIVPSFTDIHLHAPQYLNRGLGTDKELMDWLKIYTFPEEEKFRNMEYAEKVWKKVINDLWECGSLHSAVFSSIHEKATEKLIELFMESGLSAYVGKVNMDRNTNESYFEEVEEGMVATERIIRKYEGTSELVRTIITPRFAITCSEDSLKRQGELSDQYRIPVQSHLNENFKEIEFTMSLFPEYENYSEIYNKNNLFGKNAASIMAHCIYNSEKEVELISKNNVYPVYCPESNANLMSGIMDARSLLNLGAPVCIASDISGGHSLFLPRQIVLGIQMSKMKARFENDFSKVIKNSEGYYMATKNPGSFFGKTGSLEIGYEANFLVVDVSDIVMDIEKRSITEKFEKWLYIGSEKNIQERYMKGRKLEKPF